MPSKKQHYFTTTHPVNASPSPLSRAIIQPMHPLTIGSEISSVKENHNRPVTITEDERHRPVYLIGKPYTGKSIVLDHLIRQDIESGNGFVFMALR